MVEKDNRSYLEYFWDNIPTAEESILILIPALGTISSKILEVQSTNVTEVACQAAFEYIKQNPLKSAAALLTLSALSYKIYNFATEGNESQKILKEQEKELNNKFTDLTNFLEDIESAYGHDNRIKVSMGALKEYHDDIVEDFKNGKGIDPQKLKDIQFIYTEMLRDLPKENIDKIIGKSLDFIDSVKKCDQIRENLSQGKSFTSMLERENNRGEVRGR